MRNTVFVSLAPSDASRAAGIAALLRRRGIAVTGDLTIPSGTPREEVLAPALAEAAVVPPLWSAASAETAFVAAEALATEDVGFAKRGSDYDSTLRSDHLGWTGLLLVTGAAPLPHVPAQGTVLASAAFADWLRGAGRTGDQRAEMAWYEIMPR